MLRKIKKLGVDFDGVIVDSNHSFPNEFITIGKNLTGRETSVEEIFSVWGITLPDLLERFYPEISLSAFLQERNHLGFHRNFPTLIPGVIEAIKLISTKIPISIITNRDSRTLFEILEVLQVDTGLFERIQSSNDTAYDKPDPRVFNDFLVPYKAEEMLYVGDHHKVDYLPACGAGIHFIGVLSGGISTREDFRNAGVPKKMILNSLADLPARLGIFV